MIERVHESTVRVHVHPRRHVHRRRNEHGQRCSRTNSASVYAPMLIYPRTCFGNIHMPSLPACTVITCNAALKYDNIMYAVRGRLLFFDAASNHLRLFTTTTANRTLHITNMQHVSSMTVMVTCHVSVRHVRCRSSVEVVSEVAL